MVGTLRVSEVLTFALIALAVSCAQVPQQNSSQREPAKLEQKIENLIQQLGHQDPRLREEAAWALGEVKDKRAIEPLIGAIGDIEWKVRRAATMGLASLKEERCSDALVRALSDTNSDVRWAAAKGLGEIKYARATDPLVKTLGDEDPDMRSQATRARLELLDLLAAPEPDMKTIVVKQEEILAGQRRMQELVIKHILAEKELLTPEQLKELFNLLRQRSRCGGRGPMIGNTGQRP
jgi:HEAT repeat protein